MMSRTSALPSYARFHIRPIALTRSVLPLAVAALLSACVPAAQRTEDLSTKARGSECLRSGGANCFFLNAPVRLTDEAITLPGRPYTFFPTAEPLDFVDAGRRTWTAPVRTLTDGASIPRLFVPIVGEPRTREFANASALHDAYCGIGNEDGPKYHSDTWQNVHRMFHDTLVVGGTPPLKAKVMFAAVWLGGPRWYPVSGAPDERLSRVPAPAMIASMKAAKSYIERENPSLDALVLFLQRREAMMLAQAPRHGDRAGFAEGQQPGRDPTDPGEGEPGVTSPGPGEPGPENPGPGQI